MLNIVRLILLYFIFIIFTLLLCVGVGRGDHHLQFWWYTTRFCLRLKLSAAFAEHVVGVWLLKRHFHPAPTHVLIFHQQISETTSRLVRNGGPGSASLTGYDLLHVPWDGFPVIAPMMVFISSPHESTLVRWGTSIFAEFKCAGRRGDDSGVQPFHRGHCHLVDEDVHHQRRRDLIRPLNDAMSSVWWTFFFFSTADSLFYNINSKSAHFFNQHSFFSGTSSLLGSV